MERLHLFNHHIYELKKGLRNLVLYSALPPEVEPLEQRLKKNGIAYICQKVSDRKVNVFFGSYQCVKIIRMFNQSDLSKLTDEQDFILGVMLGYDIRLQCERFSKRKEYHLIAEKNPQAA